MSVCHSTLSMCTCEMDALRRRNPDGGRKCHVCMGWNHLKITTHAWFFHLLLSSPYLRHVVWVSSWVFTNYSTIKFWLIDTKNGRCHQTSQETVLTRWSVSFMLASYCWNYDIMASCCSIYEHSTAKWWCTADSRMKLPNSDVPLNGQDSKTLPLPMTSSHYLWTNGSCINAW